MLSVSSSKNLAKSRIKSTPAREDNFEKRRGLPDARSAMCQHPSQTITITKRTKVLSRITRRVRCNAVCSNTGESPIFKYPAIDNESVGSRKIGYTFLDDAESGCKGGKLNATYLPDL